MQKITFQLKPVPPFRLDLTVWALRRRSRNEIDGWDGKVYSRVTVVGKKAVLVNVTQLSNNRLPVLRVTAFAKRIDLSLKPFIASILERLLGLQVDLNPFYHFAAEEPTLNSLVQRFKGLKPPRFESAFEALVNGIACQQLSLEAGLTILNRLVERVGLPFGSGEQIRHAFPRPEEIGAVPTRSLRALGFNMNKTIALKTISQEIISGRLNLEILSGCTNGEVVFRLLELRGIGRWTAEYVLLRGLGRIDVFPGDDVGARNNLSRWLKIREAMDYSRVEKTLRRWGSYKGLIYFHLLLDGLERSGRLKNGAPENLVPKYIDW